MNFHFVDRILALEPGKKAIGLKHVSVNDMYLTKTRTGVPALLTCIVGEALGQLCSWNIIKTTDCQVRSVGGIVSEVNMLGFAYLGDTVRLEINIDHLDEQAVNWHGHAEVNGHTILKIQSSIGPCLAMHEFNDIDEVRTHLNIIDRPGVLENIPEGQANIAELPRYHLHLVQYDRIIVWQSGQQVLAQKNIPIIAPYFSDHFPKKPVFPISLLLETQLQLAYAFLNDWLGEDMAENFMPSRVYNIKMKDFVLPGDILFTRLTLQEFSDDLIVLLFQSEVNGRRLCVAKADFVRCTR